MTAVTIPPAASPFLPEGFVIWIIPNTMARIASGIFRQLQNNTMDAIPSARDAIPNPSPAGRYAPLPGSW